jgi:hypothetical protein
MSTTLIICPLVVTTWPVLVPVLTAAVTSLGYALAADQTHTLNEEYDEEYEEDTTRQRVREEIIIEESEILAEAQSRGETLTLVKDNVKATFHRDVRGTLRLTIDAVGLSKEEANKIGEELIGKVTQHYAYHRLVTEVKERGMTIVEEIVEEDDTVKIRVRNTI